MKRMQSKKILIVDDEELIRKLVRDYFKKEGYIILEACDGISALDILSKVQDISLVLLDVMLPGYDGFTICREIRKTSKVPIIMLTARSHESDQLLGFEIGADEYVPKPFNPNILVARVNAFLRRTEKRTELVHSFDGLVIDDSARGVFLDNEPVDLSSKEYDLLFCLAENAGKALSREQILNSVWSYDYFGGLRTVDTHINRLRAKLRDKGNYIQTVRGFGYKFEVQK
jgi:two-component system, OmpR family, response regulator ResD